MEKDEFKDIDLSAEKKKIIREIKKIDISEITDYSKAYTKPTEKTNSTDENVAKEENKPSKETFWVKLTKIFR